MPTRTAKKTISQKAPSLISDAKLQQMYAMMLKCRMVESHTRSQSKGSAWKSKEAVGVGVAIDLRPEDTIVFSSNAAVASLLKGAALRSIFQQIKRDSSRGIKQRGKSIARPGAGAQCALATGISYARNAENKGSVTVAFLSESPDTSNAGRDALRFAAEQHLPIIYVYSAEADMAQMYSYGFPLIPVDGCDVVAVYRVAHECTIRARRGGGPSVIVCRFLPKNGRTGSSQDPLQNMEKYLTAKGLFKKERKQSTILAFEKAISGAKRRSRDSRPLRETQHLFVM